MLSRRWILNLALLVLIAALLLAGLVLQDAPVEETSTSISELSANEIDRLVIEGSDGNIKLVRNAGAWIIESPLNWPAQQEAVERLLSIVDVEAQALGDSEGVDLAPLGLQQPLAALRLNDSRLVFGTNNNIGARRYVMIESSIYLLPDAHLAFVSQGLAGVIDRRLLPARFKLQVLELPELDVRRANDGSWFSTRAPHLKSAQLESLATGWQELAATRVTPLDANAEPRQFIEAQLSGDSSVEFLVISTEPEIVIANPRAGLQYHFRADDYRRLLAATSDENPA